MKEDRRILGKYLTIVPVARREAFSFIPTV